MPYRTLTRDEHLSANGKPKRILALDGGGLRGILSLGILQRIEDLLRARHGGAEDFRLCDYFDLIAGTSTGAIIAAALAQGWTVAQARDRYFSLGPKVFEKSLFRVGLLRAKYDKDKLIVELKDTFGANATLGGPQLRTGLLIVTKRLDTGSPWPMSNNPRSKYFAPSPTGRLGNGDFPLWQVVRASTAAPAYFDPESITIASGAGLQAVNGDFVDGGVSPFNNPALQAFMYATVVGYGLGWSAGPDKLQLVSVGTGAADPAVKRASFAAGQAVGALLSLMEDCAALQETMLQWMSSSTTARVIDRELGDLRDDQIGNAKHLTYLRYNVDLRAESVKELDNTLTDANQIRSLSEMDAPENMRLLHELGIRAAARDVRDADFHSQFDVPADTP
jgi:predicted acylesterase/phospholipase RssA